MWAFMAALGVAKQTGVVSPSYGVYRPRQPGCLLPDFVNHLLRVDAYKSEYLCRSTGIRTSRLRLYPEQFLRIPILCPPPDEQAAIVRFLRHLDGRVRRYIRAKRRISDLLNEQKQAIVHRAVTRGLDPNVRLKPSGVEWLGDVPEDWEHRSLKFLVRNVNEQVGSKLPEEIYVALEHVEGWTGRITLPDDDVPFDSQVKRFQCNDVLFGKLRPYLAKVARPTMPGVCVGEFLVLRTIGATILPEFLEQKLRSRQLIDRINSATFGAKMPRADWTFIGNLVVTYPPTRDEQKQTLDGISEQTVALQAAIDKTRREIELIHEYRAHVITSVVTGKLDVRTAAACLPDELEEAEPIGETDLIAGDGDEDELDAVPEEADA